MIKNKFLARQFLFSIKILFCIYYFSPPNTGAGSRSVLVTNGSVCRSGRPQKHTGLDPDADPDSEHCRQFCTNGFEKRNLG
jgi:hypothetical protein